MLTAGFSAAHRATQVRRQAVAVLQQPQQRPRPPQLHMCHHGHTICAPLRDMCYCSSSQAFPLCHCWCAGRVCRCLSSTGLCWVQSRGGRTTCCQLFQDPSLVLWFSWPACMYDQGRAGCKDSQGGDEAKQAAFLKELILFDTGLKPYCPRLHPRLMRPAIRLSNDWHSAVLIYAATHACTLAFAAIHCE